MAVGDIKKFGMLQATLNGRNINLRRVNSDSAPLWDAEGYTNFTIVENTTGLDAYNIEWIEDRYNGKSVYISKNALFLDMRAKDYLANINKKIKTIGIVKYHLFRCSTHITNRPSKDAMRKNEFATIRAMFSFSIPILSIFSFFSKRPSAGVHITTGCTAAGLPRCRLRTFVM